MSGPVSSEKDVSPPDMHASLRTVAMPADANPSGDIFGGWLLSQMDLAGSLYIYHPVKGRAVTVAVRAMEFHRPVYIGDEVSCYCTTECLGRTSISVRIETWVRRRAGGHHEKVTAGVFVYVAVDEHGRPRPIPRD